MLAAIATGLGFIGAGIIFRDEQKLPKGLTTAAGLWTTVVLIPGAGGLPLCVVGSPYLPMQAYR